MSKGDWSAIALLLIPFSILMFVVGDVRRAEIMRDEAVKAGHAEYYLDANHNRQWRWLNDREGE